jgi:putative aldouronate transport system permease protein
MDIQQIKQAGVKNNSKFSFWHDLYRDKYLYMLILPGVLFFLIFKYIPMWGIVIAFQEYSPYLGIMQSEWVGFEHFQRFFLNPDFYILLRNTLMISLLNLVFFFPLPILLALSMNEVSNRFFKRTVQSIVYLPHFLSWVVITGITFLLLSNNVGIINILLEYFGFQRIDFLMQSNMFWGLLTVQSIWKDAGWGTIIFLAAITSVDPSLYESAKMDGANRLRQIWHITLPGIRNVIVILLILRLGNIMDVGFEQVFLMQNAAVASVSDVIETYVYRNGIEYGQFSYTTAVGLFKSIIGLALVVGADWVAKRFGEEGVY